MPTNNVEATDGDYRCRTVQSSRRKEVVTRRTEGLSKKKQRNKGPTNDRQDDFEKLQKKIDQFKPGLDWL